MTDLYRPKEARDRLDVSESTLRRWCADFADWLSPSASAAITETGGVAQRMFTENDLVFLAKVKHVLADGQSSKDVKRRLESGEDLPTPPPPRHTVTEPLTGGFFGPWRPSDEGDDETGVVADRNNMALLAMAQTSAFQVLADLRLALDHAETQGAQRHEEVLAKQQELIDVTREQAAAQRELAAALQAQLASQAHTTELEPPSTPDAVPGAMERLRRWVRGSG